MASGKIETIITGKDTSGKAFKSFSVNLTELNQGIELLSKAMDALVAPFAAVIDEGSQFTAQMSAVAAISKTTADEFSKLTDEAKRIGETTAFTAIQAGEAMEELRRAGLDTADTLTTTAQAMDLAAATGSDLATAARVVAVQMKVFEGESLQAKKAVDLMVQTVGASPQDFSALTAALETSGGVASAMGIDFKELTGILGAMANAGVRGEKAGTALNGAIARLLNPAKGAADVLTKYGISLDQVNPTTQKFADILDTLKDAEIEQKDLLTLLGQEAGPKFFKVIDQGGDSIRDFTKAQEESNTAAEAARIRLDNLTGDVTLFDSAMSGIKIQIFETFDDVLRGVVQQSTAMAGAFTAFLKQNQGPMTAFFQGLGDKMDTVKEVIASMVRGFGFLLEGFGQLLSSGPVLEFIDQLEKAFTKIYTEGILPLVGKIREFIEVIFETVSSNEDLSVVLENVFKLFGIGVGVISDLSVMAYQLIAAIIGVASDAFGPLFDILVKVVRVMTEDMLSAIDFVNDSIDAVGGAVKTITGVWKSFMDMIDDTLQDINTTITNVKETWDSFVQGFKDALEPVRKFKQFMDGVDDTINRKLKAGFKVGADAVVDFTKKIVGADEASKDLSWTLVGNTLSVDAKVTGDAFIAAGRSLQQYGLDTDEANKASKELNKTISDTGDELDDVTAKAKDAGAALAEASASGDFSGLGDIGISAAKKITGVSGAIEGFAQGGVAGAIAGAIMELLFANEQFAEAFGELNKTIGEVIAPLLVEFIPIIKELTVLAKAMAPIFKKLAPLLGAFLAIFTTMIGGVVALVDFFVDVAEDLSVAFERFGEGLEGVAGFLEDLIDSLDSLLEPIADLIDALSGGVGGAASEAGNLLSDIGSVLGFAGGSDGLTQDQLLRIPGMEVGSGLIKAHVGEVVTPAGEANGVGGAISITMNVRSINPREQTNEIRQLLEELFLSGRLRVA